jgi:2-alkyl-3-oxoalkanoate reductase
MEPAGRKVFVTGATGLLGSGLCRRLLDSGATVVGLVRSRERAEDLAALGVILVEGDLSQGGPSAEPVGDLGLPAREFDGALEGCDLVLHCAGVMGPDFDKPRSYFREVNVEGTKRVAEAALAARVRRFVYVSTAWVYGFDAAPGTDESSPRHPSGDSYCDTKLETEELVRRLIAERGLPAVIVQPAEVYGPGDRSWTLTPVRLLKSGRMMLPAGGRGVLQPIYVDDAVEGILLAAERGRVGEAYLLAGPAEVTCSEFFSFYADMVGRRSIPSVPARAAKALAVCVTGFARMSKRPAMITTTAVRGMCLQATYNGEKARSELGFEAKTDLAVGMRAVKQWLADTGELA